MKSVAESPQPSASLPPPFAPTQEVRLAVVMYGGVSLAIYINGVAQELLRLVRATAPHTPRGAPKSDDALRGRALLRDDELSASEHVYRKLGQLLGRHLVDEDPQAEPDAESPIRTRFVVDIISGSSAGGINAVYLGKALATGRGIEQLRDLWIDEGDVELLLNDKDSAPSKELPVSDPPSSLFNSQRMYWQLLDALDKMDGAESVFPTPISSFVDELDVFLTATDLQGLLLPIELYDRTVWEHRYRNAFRFSYGTAYARGRETHDFERADNPFLAFACRCTASFPFAFEPMTLEDIDAVVACEPFGWYKQQGLDSASERWKKYFDDYGDPRYYRARAFADGGYLDNKPFTWATRNLRRRRRDLAVDRRLVYIEPDPGSLAAVPKNAPGGGTPPAQPDVGARPNALANVRAATLSLPRKETIRDDLGDLIERNRAIDELGRVRRAVERATNELLEPFDRLPLADWRSRPVTQLIADRGPLYGAYHRLKIAQTTEDLGSIVSSALGLDKRSDDQEAITRLVRLWVDQNHPEDGEGERSQNEFLVRFDLGYRTRRLNFLLDRSTWLLRLQDDALRALARVGSVPTEDGWRTEFRDWLYLFRPVLGDAIVTLRARLSLLASTGPENPLHPRLQGLGITPELVAALLAARDKEAESALTQLAEPLTALMNELTETLRPLFERQRALIAGLLGLPPEPGLSPEPAGETPALAEGSGEQLAQGVMRHYWEAFETYDAVLFPVGYGVVGESDRVEVVRISPADATSLIDERLDGKRKLGGTEIHHFGGFFDRRWRRNDFLWGRLDAAERLITTLLPDPERASELITEAHLAILAEEYDTASRSAITEVVVQGLLEQGESGAEGGFALTPEQAAAAVASASTPEAILAYYDHSFGLDREPDAAKMLRITGRAMTVSGRILDGLSEQPQVGAAARWISRLGRALTGLIALSTGQSFLATLARNALVLPFLAGVLLVLTGWLFGSDPTAHAGYAFIYATAAVWLLIGLTRDALLAFPPAGKRAWVFFLLRVVALLVLAFTAFAALYWGLPDTRSGGEEESQAPGFPP